MNDAIEWTFFEDSSDPQCTPVPPATVIPTTHGVATGHVDGAHGEQGHPAPQYVPTLTELEVLARHWAEVHARITVFWAAHEQDSAREGRDWAHAADRLAAAAPLLGDKAVRDICDTALEQEIALYHPVVTAYLRDQFRPDPASDPSAGAAGPIGSAPQSHAGGDADALKAEALRLAERAGGAWPERVREAAGLGPSVWLRAVISNLRRLDGNTTQGSGS